jgi:hypothetical protein
MATALMEMLYSCCGPQARAPFDSRNPPVSAASFLSSRALAGVTPALPGSWELVFRARVEASEVHSIPLTIIPLTFIPARAAQRSRRTPVGYWMLDVRPSVFPTHPFPCSRASAPNLGRLLRPNLADIYLRPRTQPENRLEQRRRRPHQKIFHHIRIGA